MTQQTATNYGQSWPELVYLPISYLFDETARHFLGMDDPTGYFTVVAPHEVAHQWWGHDVGFLLSRPVDERRLRPHVGFAVSPDGLEQGPAEVHASSGATSAVR